MKRAYVDTPEGQIHYLTEGSGKALLLLHMTPLSANMYRRLIPYLSRSRRVVAMDTLGFGNSDPPPASYTQIGDYARNVAHFLDALGIGETDVLGMLTGSVIAAETAIQFPQRVRRLVLFPYAMWKNEQERTERIAEAKKKRAVTPKADGSHVADVLRAAYGRTVDAAHPVDDADFDYMNDWICEAVRAGTRIVDIQTKIYAYVSEARLPLIQAPTLVVALGGEIVQHYNTPERARMIHALIPGSDYIEMKEPDADFRVWYTRPAQVAEIILRFLDGAAPASAADQTSLP